MIEVRTIANKVLKYFQLPIIRLFASVIAALILYFIINLLNNWTNPQTLIYVKKIIWVFENHKISINTFLFLIILFVLNSIIFAFRSLKKIQIVDKSCIFYYNDNLDGKETKKSDLFIKEKGLESKNIFYIGATGWNSFGEENALLHGALKKCTRAEILLLNPDSENVRIMASNLGVEYGKFRQEIKDSIAWLTCGSQELCLQ